MIYQLLVNDKPMPEVYTSIKPLFKEYNVPYNNVTRNKTLFYRKAVKYEVITLTLNKIVGRGNKDIGKY